MYHPRLVSFCFWNDWWGFPLPTRARSMGDRLKRGHQSFGLDQATPESMIAFADVTSFCYCLSCTHLLCDYLSLSLSLLCVVVYGWCWSITLSIPLFSHIVHSSECITLVWCPSVFELIEGDFLCPRVLAAWEIGANEVVSLLVWSRPLLSRWLRLLMLPPFSVFHLHNLLCVSISLKI